MRAIIFSAGLGTRLKPLTNNTPKPMVKIAGKPVLEHIADHLNSHGIHEIIVNLHYKPEKIYKHFGSRFMYFYEPKLLGEDETVRQVRYWLEQPFLAVNGDTLTEVNTYKMFNFHLNSQANRTIFTNDSKTPGGMWMYWQSYFSDKKDVTYVSDEKWIDIGTPEGLQEARKYYEGSKNG